MLSKGHCVDSLAGLPIACAKEEADGGKALLTGHSPVPHTLPLGFLLSGYSTREHLHHGHGAYYKNRHLGTTDFSAKLILCIPTCKGNRARIL